MYVYHPVRIKWSGKRFGFRQRKKEEKLAEKGEKVAKDPLDVTNYELGGNNIFLRFRESTIMNFYNHRLCQATQFGQKIVVDCGYNESMTEREQRNCAKQMMMLFADNRFHDGKHA